MELWPIVAIAVHSILIVQASTSGFNITDVRLVDGAIPSEGRLEVLVPDYSTEWQTVSSWGFGYDEASVICRELGYPAANNVDSWQFGFVDHSSLGIECVKDEDSIAECSAHPDYVSFFTSEVICYERGYLGCYPRDLPELTDVEGPWRNSSDIQTEVTIPDCVTWCNRSENAYTYAAVYRGGTCLCGNASLAINQSASVQESMCNERCTGRSINNCGVETSPEADGTIYAKFGTTESSWNFDNSTLYPETSSTSSLSGNVTCNQKTEVQHFKDCGFLGCYPFHLSELTNLETPFGITYNIQNMTIPNCITWCERSGKAYLYAGVLTGASCLCGSASIFIDPSSRVPETSCNSPCIGRRSEFCGGPSHVALFNIETTRTPSILPGTNPYPTLMMETCNCNRTTEVQYSQGGRIGLIVVVAILLLYALVVTFLLIRQRRKGPSSMTMKTEEKGHDPYMDLQPRPVGDGTN
ncbi:uncharacterized protein LOC129280928 isoform X2 [Lytechinus pictus]|uniref:uncharacterized protein LOC129280928 isoform X2 n=1 Tax=Lytechinus pictus TaxID=7653 RepID=UPI0030B9B160